MKRPAVIRTLLAAILLSTVSSAALFAPIAAAAGPDPAEVVIVLDFSASILDDEANRDRFADALDRLADRVVETSEELAAGDATLSIVRFASRAADVEGCTGLRTLERPKTVQTFADCLRSVARAYRTGITSALTRSIGIDTNYVAAMEQAARHLPADGLRPTLILFSDGRHDVAGVPVGEVAPALERLFGNRSPFALLPVGMGLEASARPELEAGLARLRTIRDMPACATGSVIEWPTVVFESVEDAGNAVGVALQNATCTFTVEATPEPTPTPTPVPVAAVSSVRVTPLDGRIEVRWSAPTGVVEPITDYLVRCAAEGEDPIASSEGVSVERSAIVEGLTNGREYRCEVAPVTAASAGEYVAAAAPAIPTAVPPAPAKPSVEALDGGIRVSVPADSASSAETHRFECSADDGTTWPADENPPSTTELRGLVGGLTNGVAYVCRAFAANGSGVSEASPLSDAVTPCGSFLECTGLPVPVLGIVAVILVAVIGFALLILLRDRNPGYVIAVVDVVHTANLGSKSKLGIRFERSAQDRRVEGIVADGSSKAEIQIRQLGGDRFKVKDRDGIKTTQSGQSLVVVDSTRTPHEVVLRKYSGRAASGVTDRR